MEMLKIMQGWLVHAAMIRHNRNHIPTIMIAMMMAKPKPRNYKNRITCYFRLSETNSSHQNIDPWKRSVPYLETIIFRGELLVLGRVKSLRLAARCKKIPSQKSCWKISGGKWTSSFSKPCRFGWPVVFSRLVAFPLGFLPLGHPRPKDVSGLRCRIIWKNQGCDWCRCRYYPNKNPRWTHGRTIWQNVVQLAKLEGSGHWVRLSGWSRFQQLEDPFSLWLTNGIFYIVKFWHFPRLPSIFSSEILFLQERHAYRLTTDITLSLAVSANCQVMGHVGKSQSGKESAAQHGTGLSKTSVGTRITSPDKW